MPDQLRAQPEPPSAPHPAANSALYLAPHGPQTSLPQSRPQSPPQPLLQGSQAFPADGKQQIPRNVSFANHSSELTAYREHNPPAVLRRQEAARREMTPQSRRGSQQNTEFSTGVAGAVFSLPSTTTNSPQPVQPSPSSGLAGAPLQFSVKSPNLRSPSSRSPNTVPAVPMHHPPLVDLKLESDDTEDPDANKVEEVHILVAVTGSVATIKLPLIVHKLKQIYRKRAVIQVVVTKASTTFFDRADLPKDVPVWCDSDEWRSREASVTQTSHATGHFSMTAAPADQLHIRLRRWADILLVAPCSANTLAKLTYGICDNLLTSIFRVWNPEVPILLAPAMNTHMYSNPVTKRHFGIIKESYPFVEILRPVEKVLVCGDIGMGGMREWNDIVQTLVRRIGVNPDSDSDSDSNSDRDSDDDDDDDDDDASDSNENDGPGA